MNHILLIDAHSLIHRCYHAVPPLTNNRGEAVGALYGVSNVLLKIMSRDGITHAAALFDRPEPTFRKQKFSDYKANRPKIEDDLVSQLNEARDLFRAFGIPVFDLVGYEGDDLIGTFVEKFKSEPHTIITILTGDMDSLQLVDKNVEVETFKKGISDIITYHESEVIKRLGVKPNQVVDYKALVGDASDNIPGVAGIGPKTASAILQKYETLERYFKEGINDKFYQKIIAHKNTALLSQDLARIDIHAPIKVSLENLIYRPDQELIQKYFKQQGFVSLLKRLEKKESLKIEEIKTKEALSETPLEKKRAADPASFEPIRIAFILLGFKDASWQEYAQIIFKEQLSYNEFIKRTSEWIKEKIKRENLEYLYETIELPLIPILQQIHERGILIDKKHLNALHEKLNQAIQKQERIVRKDAGKEINLNSPKQLLELLNTKFGAKIKSTSAPTLQKIQNKIPWVHQLLTYRELFKLQSTYVSAFRDLIAPDGRIHPTFLQLGAATGRLSCQNPNLQNIPQESLWSEEIRNMFIAPAGSLLVAIDYSQIELRVLASLAHDENMIQAFKEGKDIHTITAQKIFGVPEDQITKQMRRSAKTLNFGMVYGMGFRALAQQTGLSNDEAKEFIKKYFAEFSSIKKWQDTILAEAKKTGRATSSTGRFRLIPDINSHNGFFASQAEREAINMPTQGLAADIMKLAMIRVSNYIQKEKLEEKIKIILTIHDELIFEIDEKLLSNGIESNIIKNIQREMEQALPINPTTKKTPLLVPLKTDVHIGKRWGELK